LAQLQPVQRRLTRNRRTVLASGFKLARQHRHHRIVAQLVVVVEILVAQRNPVHPLTDQRRYLMLDQFRTSRVVKTPRKPIDQSGRRSCRPKQQRAGIRRDRPTVKCSHHLAACNRCKSK